MQEPDTLELRSALQVVLPSGEQYLLRPGPYGKGIAVSALDERAQPLVKTVARQGKRGRKPRASTLKLRSRLEKDASHGALHENQHYIRWLLRQDDTLSMAVARQVVYRERRRYA